MMTMLLIVVFGNGDDYDGVQHVIISTIMLMINDDHDDGGDADD